jgi:hypothetical protein
LETKRESTCYENRSLPSRARVRSDAISEARSSPREPPGPRAFWVFEEEEDKEEEEEKGNIKQTFFPVKNPTQFAPIKANSISRLKKSNRSQLRKEKNASAIIPFLSLSPSLPLVCLCVCVLICYVPRCVFCVLIVRVFGDFYFFFNRV